MRTYRVLIVDDEPHVIETVAELLEGAPGYAIDVYRAANGTEALRLLDKGRVDLVISDIEMPGMNGLELLRAINERWPMCRVAFLTAHSNFSYAYDAIQQRAVTYLLKTEAEEVLLAKILHALDTIWQELRLTSAQLGAWAERSPLPARRLIERLLGPNEMEGGMQRHILEQLGLADGTPLFFVLGFPGKAKSPVPDEAVHELICFHLQSLLEKAYYHRSGEMLVWMLRLRPCGERGTSKFFGLLETAQASCTVTFGMPLSLIVQGFDPASQTPRNAFQSALAQRGRIANSAQPVLFLHDPAMDKLLPDGHGEDIVELTIAWVRRYIDEHCTEDVSLMTLSTLTGYNAQYLSGIFHQRTGLTLSRYAAQKRMELARAVLADRALPIQEAALRLGFNSRSYFNRFIKQETGQTPQQLRAAIWAKEEAGRQLSSQAPDL